MLPEENILFNGVDQCDRHRMITCFKPEIKHYKTGSVICSCDETNDRIGIIISGKAIMVRYDINGNRTIIETLEEQGVFGTLFTFNVSCRNTVEIISETECDIMFIKRSEITKRCENACACHTTVVENLLNLMSEKAITLNERIEVLSQRTISDKLISCLQIIEEKNHTEKSSRLPFSITALSDYLCVNRSALQREIKKLQENGELEISKGKFRLCGHNNHTV